jgi:hypothetical protein
LIGQRFCTNAKSFAAERNSLMLSQRALARDSYNKASRSSFIALLDGQ